MKVTILTGGTGSIALQRGLYGLYGDKLEISYLVNFYDNGKSTGLVRKVYNGKIGGPSDIRKNQMTRAMLECVSLDIVKFCEHRFTSAKPYKYIIDKLNELCLNEDKHKILLGAIEHYFEQPLALQIVYDDFAIGNIIYAGLAGKFNNSMQCAADIMKDVLGISANCVISDDKSLFLGAVTQSGCEIIDEGQIVEWSNINDKIKYLTYHDENGLPDVPKLSERAKKTILESDLIICSSGTQWSSLIPTYEAKGFFKALDEAYGKIYLIMNCTEDKDMLGVDAAELWEIVKNKLPSDKVTIIQNDDRENIMSNMIKHINVIKKPLTDYSNKHEPIDLVLTIFEDYWREQFNCEVFGFDWDNTIKGRRNTFEDVSKENIKLLNELKKDKFICTGNTIDVIKIKNIPIYAENGLNFYYLGQKECLSEQFQLKDLNKLISFFINLGVKFDKISNRNYAILSIKPLSELERVLLKKIFDESEWSNTYKLVITGTSTVDIMNKVLKKDIILEHKLVKNKKICYLGDEPEGNDRELFKSSLIKSFYTKNPNWTYLFLKTLIYLQNERQNE